MGLFGKPDVWDLESKGDLRGVLKALRYKSDVAVRQRAVFALGTCCFTSRIRWR